MLCNEDIIQINDIDLQEQLEKTKEIEDFSSLVAQYSEISKLLAKKLLEKELNRRSSKKINWPKCPECKTRIENKETKKREIISIMGTVCEKRKVGRCPNGCKIGDIVPGDDLLGLEKKQKICRELQKSACALAVFVPYQTASTLIFLLLRIRISHTTIWNWVQKFGQQQNE